VSATRPQSTATIGVSASSMVNVETGRLGPGADGHACARARRPRQIGRREGSTWQACRAATEPADDGRDHDPGAPAAALQGRPRPRACLPQNARARRTRAGSHPPSTGRCAVVHPPGSQARSSARPAASSCRGRARRHAFQKRLSASLSFFVTIAAASTRSHQGSSRRGVACLPATPSEAVPSPSTR
jgi:hypothetical protein